MKNCRLCNRVLGRIDDPLSINCGGDCLACMIDNERMGGNHTMTEIEMRDRIVFLELEVKQLIKCATVVR